jgi:hypothetical protein
MLLTILSNNFSQYRSLLLAAISISTALVHMPISKMSAALITLFLPTSTPSSATESLAVGTVQLSTRSFLGISKCNAASSKHGPSDYLFVEHCLGDPIGDPTAWLHMIRLRPFTLPGVLLSWSLHLIAAMFVFTSLPHQKTVYPLISAPDGYVSRDVYLIDYGIIDSTTRFARFPITEALTLHGLLAGPSIFISILLCLYLLFISFPRPLVSSA